MTWAADERGVVEMPNDRRVRGRRFGSPASTEPDFGLYLLWREPTPTWPYVWVKWPDFGVPSNGEAAHRAIHKAWSRSPMQRVEVSCGGGRGRTGTTLAAMAMLDGLERDAAVEWVRTRYDQHAVETPWQRAWLKC